MSNIAIPETGLFKLVLLVTGIVVGMFLATAFVALAFMPNSLIVTMVTQENSFLLPLTLSTICSGVILAWYVRSYIARQKK